MRSCSDSHLEHSFVPHRNLKYNSIGNMVGKLLSQGYSHGEVPVIHTLTQDTWIYIRLSSLIRLKTCSSMQQWSSNSLLMLLCMVTIWCMLLSPDHTHQRRERSGVPSSNPWARQKLIRPHDSMNIIMVTLHSWFAFLYRAARACTYYEKQVCYSSKIKCSWWLVW